MDRTLAEAMQWLDDLGKEFVAECLLQINQRVPDASDIVVKRLDGNCPLAKRDVEHFLRRLVPTVSLRIAKNVAGNDWLDRIDDIAVNCWARFFEKTTGRLKDAFICRVQDGI